MKRSKETLLINVLLIFSIFLSITSFLTDISNTMKYGGVDLRNRVVGARLLKKDLDPYFYKWEKGDPVELLDPRDKVNSEVNMVTVPPSLLLLMSPLADVRYNAQRMIWFAVQWLLLLFSIFLFSRANSNLLTRKLIWIIGLFFISSSFFWRLHIERGQVYILYVALISLVYYLNSIQSRHKQLWSGIMIGFVVVLRPTLVLIPTMFLLYKNWKIILGSIIGAFSILGVSLFVSGLHVWNSYFKAMQIHGLNHMQGIEKTISNYPYQNIEGIANLHGLANIPITDTSLQGLLKSIGVYVPGYVLMLGFLAIFALMILFLWKRKIHLSTEMIFLIGSFLVFISDFFLAAARFPYNNVMILPIISIVVLRSEELLEYFYKK